jgi:hypothetical protein
MISISFAIFNFPVLFSQISNTPIKLQSQMVSTTTNTQIKYKTDTVQISPTGEKMSIYKGVGLQSLSEEEKKDPNTSLLRGVYLYFIHVWYSDEYKIASFHATSCYRNKEETQQSQLLPFSGRSLINEDVIFNQMQGMVKFKGKVVDEVENYLSKLKSNERNVANDENTLEYEIKNNSKYTYRLPKVLYVQVNEYESGHKIMQTRKSQSNVQTKPYFF